jgi:ribosome recycling factor
MRHTIPLRLLQIRSQSVRPLLAASRRAIPTPTLSLARPLSTSAPLLKKSKAAATKKAHKQHKEEADGNPEGKRYDKAPEADLGDVLAKTERKMEKAVDWAKGLVYEMVERGRGRVSPGERLFELVLAFLGH